MNTREEEIMHASIAKFRAEKNALLEQKISVLEAKRAELLTAEMEHIDSEISRVDARLMVIRAAGGTPMAETVLEMVAGEFGVTALAVKSPSHSRCVAIPRSVVCLFLIQDIGMPSTKVALLLGGRHHTSVLSGVKSIHARMLADKRLRDRVSQLRKEVRAIVAVRSTSAARKSPISIARGKGVAA